jgi:hypothetical protein
MRERAKARSGKINCKKEQDMDKNQGAGWAMDRNGNVWQPGNAVEEMMARIDTLKRQANSADQQAADSYKDAESARKVAADLRQRADEYQAVLDHWGKSWSADGTKKPADEC